MYKKIHMNIASIFLLLSWGICVGAFLVPRRPFQARLVMSGVRLLPTLDGYQTSSSSALSSTSKSLEAILWDMDGVLADTERDAHRPAFNVAFQEYNLNTEWDVERYGKLLEIGGGKERMTAHWNQVGWPDGFPQDEDEPSRQDLVKELHLRKTDIFNEMIQSGNVPLRPGVLRIIDDAIASNIRLAVCSTSSEKAVRNLVTTLMGPDRASKFEIFAGDMVAKKKPAPDVYLMAVDKMGLDKSKCVIVEDSHIGLGAAKAAGIACIVTKSTYTAGEDFTGASMIVDDLGDDPSTGVTLETLASLLPQEEPVPSSGVLAKVVVPEVVQSSDEIGKYKWKTCVFWSQMKLYGLTL